MIKVAAIVEGYGDVSAVPLLLSRTGERLGELVIAHNPIRAGEWKAIKAKGSLPKFLELALSRGCDIILVILDLEDDCVVQECNLARSILSSWRGEREVEVEIVFLNREYETLFLHCQEDLPGFNAVNMIEDPEGKRDAKGALRQIIGRRYRETQDQKGLSGAIELSKLFSRSRAYRKLCRALTGRNYEDLESVFQ